jgi:hypothetical protein
LFSWANDGSPLPQVFNTIFTQIVSVPTQCVEDAQLLAVSETSVRVFGDPDLDLLSTINVSSLIKSIAVSSDGQHFCIDVSCAFQVSKSLVVCIE